MVGRERIPGLYGSWQRLLEWSLPSCSRKDDRDGEEVREKLTKAIADRDGGLVYDAGYITVGEYLDRWLNDAVRDTVRQRTWERYEQIARVHIKPALGRIKLKALTSTHARGLYREKLDSGLAPRTVGYVHTTLHKALKDAVADGLVPRN